MASSLTGSAKMEPALTMCQDTQQTTGERHTSSVWYKDIYHEGARVLFRDGQDSRYVTH